MDLLHYPTILNAYKHGGVVERKEVSVEGTSAPVYYVDDESWGIAGQGLAFSHIILNRARLEGEPNFVHDFVFLHETGHKQWFWPLQVLFTIGQLTYVAMLVFSLIIFPRIIFDAIVAPSLGSALLDLLGVTVAFGLLIALPLGLTWFDEGYAELYAISRLGHSTYLEVLEIKQSKSRSILSRIRGRVMYPPTSLILAISRYRNR